MDKQDLFIGDEVVALGYTNPQVICGLEDKFVVFKDKQNGIQGTQTYDNIKEVLRCGVSHKDHIVASMEASNAFGKQIAGSHYSKLKIQPMEYCLGNGLNYAQSNVVKYVTRYKDKNGIEDLKKAIHCIELLIDWEENNAD
jgi:hypothetical protein